MPENRNRARRVIVPPWALEIDLERRGQELWLECSECGFPAMSEQRNFVGFEDFLEGFYSAPRRTRGSSRNLPHLRFANASDEERLVEFVRQFGPVLARVEHVDLRGGPVTLVQDIAVLKAEQNVFAVTQKLTSIVNTLDDFSQTIVVDRSASGLALGLKTRSRIIRSDLAKLEKIEPVLEILERVTNVAVRESGRLHLANKGWKDLRDMLKHRGYHDGNVDKLATAHSLLCHIFNLFSPVLVFGVNSVVESPRKERTGIRPLLYFLLREVYLMKHRISSCKRDDCGQFFIPDRSNADYCDERCANLVRQRRFVGRRSASRAKSDTSCP